MVCHKSTLLSSGRPQRQVLVCERSPETHEAHLRCAGLSRIPHGAWFCPLCASPGRRCDALAALLDSAQLISAELISGVCLCAGMRAALALAATCRRLSRAIHGLEEVFKALFVARCGDWSRRLTGVAKSRVDWKELAKAMELAATPSMAAVHSQLKRLAAKEKKSPRKKVPRLLGDYHFVFVTDDTINTHGHYERVEKEFGAIVSPAVGVHGRSVACYAVHKQTLRSVLVYSATSHDRSAYSPPLPLEEGRAVTSITLDWKGGYQLQFWRETQASILPLDDRTLCLSLAAAAWDVPGADDVFDLPWLADDADPPAVAVLEAPVVEDDDDLLRGCVLVMRDDDDDDLLSDDPQLLSLHDPIGEEVVDCEAAADVIAAWCA